LADIIFADDEANNRLVMRMQLELLHHHVRLAADGQQALELVHQEPPDLLILDLMMPVLNGVEACLALRAEPATARLPILLLTAMDRHELPARATKAGFDAILTKPFQMAELAQVITTLAGRDGTP